MRKLLDGSLLDLLVGELSSVNRVFKAGENEEESVADNSVIYVEKEELLSLLSKLKNDDRYDFNRMPNVTSVDYKTYFEMIYTLYSITHNHWLTVKVKLEHEEPIITSVTSIYPSANFEEREVYDLMGIDFQNHPDKRRVLLPDNFEGHPLRKDYKQKHKPFIPPVKRGGV